MLPLLLLLLGDVIVEGQSPVRHEFVVEGGTGCLLVAHPTDMSGGYEVIRPGVPFSFYKFARPRVWALPAGTPLDSKWMEDPSVPRSEETLELNSSVPAAEATASIVTRYVIAGIEGSRVRLRLQSDDHFDDRGGRVRAGERSTRKQLRAMLLTLAVETIVVVLLLKRAWPSILPVVAGVNLVSHPLLWTIFAVLPSVALRESIVTSDGTVVGEQALYFLPSVALLESLVFVLEAAAYRVVARQPWRLALLASLLANALSYAAGLAMAP